MCIPARTRHVDSSPSHLFIPDTNTLQSLPTKFLFLSGSVLGPLVSHADSPIIRTIFQLHFTSWCWQQGSLVFSLNLSSSFWPVYLLKRDCLISFMDLTRVPSILQQRGTSCSSKDLTVYPLPVQPFKPFVLGKKSFLALVLAYWFLLTLTKPRSHH